MRGGAGLLSVSGGDAASQLDLPAASQLVTTVDVASPAITFQTFRCCRPVQSCCRVRLTRPRTGSCRSVNPRSSRRACPAQRTWWMNRGNLCWIRWRRTSWRPGSTARVPSSVRAPEEYLIRPDRRADFQIRPFSRVFRSVSRQAAARTDLEVRPPTCRTPALLLTTAAVQAARATSWAAHQVRSPAASSCDQ